MNIKQMLTSATLTLGLVALSVSPAIAGHNPTVVTIDEAACGEVTFSASITDPNGTHKVGNMYLVVDSEEGVQYVNVPTDGTEATINVGPYYDDVAETKTVRWHVFGGAERSYDDPLWNGYGDPDFSSDIVAYADEVGGYSWVISGYDDPNPFVTWNEMEVEGCALEEVASFNGGGQLHEELGNKRKDWHKLSFGGWATLYNDGSTLGNFQVNLHNVGDDSLDKAKFHGSDVTDMQLFDGDSATCHSAMNLTVNGALNGEDGYSMVYRAGDSGSPNTSDTARVTIYDGENATGSVVYDSHAAGEFSDESSCVGTARTGLDAGNLTISQ